MLPTQTEALAVLDSLLQYQPVGEGINDLQEQVFCYCWEGFTYQAISEQLGYDTDYIRRVGSQLWQKLSQYTEQPIQKNNMRFVIRRYTAMQTKGR